MTTRSAPTSVGLRLAAIASMVVLVVGCGTTSTNPGIPAGTAAPEAGSKATPEVANLTDLGLRNVTTETAQARAATIGPNGGTVEATASDGTTYSLAIPAGAIDKATEVSLYPVSTMTGLPTGDALTAGVQFAPDGLQLQVPATLTIALPGGARGQPLIGLSWEGDAQGVHPYPATASGSSTTFPIAHFSGAGLGTTSTPFIQPLGCTNEIDMDSLTASDLLAVETAGLTNAVRTATTNDLKTCYRDFVKPTMTAFSNLTLSATDGASVSAYVTAFHPAEWAYFLWRTVIADVNGTAPPFTVSPELEASKAVAATMLRTWYDEWNLNCTLIAPRDAATAVAFAATAISTAHNDAPALGIDTAANRLDYETLLNDLCAQIVIDPSRGFSGSKPGDQGTVTIPVGYSVAGGPIRYDETIDVSLTQTGDASPFAKGRVPSDGQYTAPLTWPDGVDLLKIDVLAYFEDFDGSNIINQIARFDRITQESGKPIQITAPTGIWSNARWPIVIPTCQQFFMSADEGNDWRFSLNGPATVTKTDGDHIYYRGTADGVVAFSGRSPTHGAGTYSVYVSVLAGQFLDASATNDVLISGHLDQEGILSFEIRQLVGTKQTDDWTNITAKGQELAGTDQLGNAIDVTVSGDQLTGTIGGGAVTVQRDCS